MAVTRGGVAAQGRSKGKAVAQGRKAVKIAGSRRKRSNPEQRRGGGDDSTPSPSRSTPERRVARSRDCEQGIAGPSRKRGNSDREERMCGARDVPSTSTPELEIIPVCQCPFGAQHNLFHLGLAVVWFSKNVGTGLFSKIALCQCMLTRKPYVC